MARQHGRGESAYHSCPCFRNTSALDPSLRQAIVPDGAATGSNSPTSKAAATPQDSGHHHTTSMGARDAGVPCVRRTKGSSSRQQRRPGFPPHRTARDALGRNEVYRKPHRRKTFLHSVQSEEPTASSRGEVESTRGRWEAQKATLRMRQSTRKSQTKLHICGEVIF